MFNKPNLNLLNNRLNLLLLIIFSLFVLVVIRLADVQIVQGNQYSQKATQKANVKVVIPAMRGNIYDSKGNLIAYSKGTYTAVFKEPESMKKQQYVDLATQLQPVLGLDRSKILSQMDCGWNLDKSGKVVAVARQTSKFLEKDLKYDLTPQQIAYLSEHRLELAGIDVSVKPVRVYDNKQVAVQAIGYVRKYGVAQQSNIAYYQNKQNVYDLNQMVGLDGIELSYEQYLQGKNGYHEYALAANQQILKELNQVPPQSGDNLYLTLDDRVQLDTRDFIKGFLPKLQSSGKTNAKTAYVVAMEVKTGKIVAMISYPEYDPNIWSKNTLDSNDYNHIAYSLINGTIRSAPYDVFPLTGKAAQDEVGKHPSSMVPTGSAIKPSTLMMGMGEQIISPYDSWADPGTYRYGRGTDSVHNDNYDNYGILTPQKALEKSSNTYMARIGDLTAQKYGKKAISIMQKYHAAFGLGVKTQVDLPYEEKGIQDFLTMNKVYGPLAAMVQSAFGQQTHYTVMQLAQYATTLANNGVRMKPQLVDRITDPNGKKIRAYHPVVLSKLNEPDIYWNTIREGMGLVTQGNGTAGTTFAGFPYPVAAKTGTSDQDIYVKSPTSNTWSKYASVSNGVFMSYAPLNNPKLAVAVVVPEGGFGASSAGIIARHVYESYDKYVGLAK
ncbi:penicillin-binding protein 2 [Aneurinibacillus sp. Ricciae_BoGa-3]|uniref:peptidoglycan D,D-transpeptidase FtsI family protein n=1 Tax=Aneurinibacillus sp. Ricciae_BoGa-3 TaxID=3022697 RepID=UPI0023409056|nr:penicillin-binding protein 2 [Aneurinibacillus sp. Ricciae_BoGa-3]WCK52543.1 penicillin-binding protein 2 [Aneurinibacillus sp. Ricciae_BoGa-3]